MKSDIFSALMLVLPALLAISSDAAETLVEASPEIAPPGLLGTVTYGPTTHEEPYYKRLDKDQRLTVKTENRDFKLGGHDGQFVSWFGIVREITTDKDGMVTGLLVENKYSHDMSDMHIQTVSINGAGDFRVALETRSEDILPLILIRVYGDVSKGKDGIPLVQAKYLRVWHWFDFNFMDYGTDQSNSRWLEKRKKGIRVYDSRVSPEYYIDRLEPTDEQLEVIKKFDIAREMAREAAGLPKDEAMQAAIVWETIESAMEDDSSEKLAQKIKRLLSSGMDPNVRDTGGYTPLLVTAHLISRPAKAFEVLLDAGADVNARNDDGDTVLHLGDFLEHDPESVRLLIARGVSVTATNNAGESAFSEIAWLLDCDPMGAEPDSRQISAKLLFAAGAGQSKDYMGRPVTVVPAVPQVLDPTVAKLANPALRDEVFREILSWQKYRAKPSAPNRIFRPLRHVVVCPQKEGGPIYAVFPTSRYEHRTGPKGHIMLIDADGAMIPYYCNANSLHDDSAFKDVNGDGMVDEVGTIAFSTTAGSAEVLHILPVTRDQIPALNIVLKRDDNNKTLWSWKLAETDEPGVYSVELGPPGAPFPEARYAWSKAESRYIGPEGGGNLPFMRLNSAEPFGSKEFDAFVRKKEGN